MAQMARCLAVVLLLARTPLLLAQCPFKGELLLSASSRRLLASDEAQVKYPPLGQVKKDIKNLLTDSQPQW